MGHWKSLCLVCGLAWGAMAVPITGVVRQIDGLPAVGARVSVEREVLPFTFAEVAAPLTDAAGVFAVDMPAGSYEVVIRGCAHDTRQRVDVIEGRPLDLRLGVDWPWSRVPMAEAEVRVIDAAGRPTAAEVEVALGGPYESMPRVNVYGERDPRFALTSDHQRLKTDAAGRLAFRVPAGVPTIILRAGGATLASALVATPGAHLPAFTLRLPEAAPVPDVRDAYGPADLRVQVLAADGRPLARQWVQIRSREDGAGYAVRTDAEGKAVVSRYVFDGQQVTAKVPGWAETEPAVMPTRWQSALVQLRLAQRSQSLRGVVRDRDGRPLAGCWVFACRPGTRSGGERDDCLDGVSKGFSTRGRAVVGQPVEPGQIPGWLTGGVYYAVTDAAGAYCLDDLEPGAWHAVFYRRGYLPQEVRAVSLGERLDAALTASRTMLGGVLRGPDGQPLRQRGALIALDRPKPVVVGEMVGTPGAPMVVRAALAPPFARGRDIPFVPFREPDRWMVVTDDAGRYQIDPDELSDGPVTVRAASRAGSGEGRNALLAPGKPCEQDLSVPGAYTVAGRVLRPDGRPAAQAWVCHADDRTVAPHWTDADDPLLTPAWTDADGRFEIRCLPRKPQPLVVFADGCAAGFMQADPGATTPAVLRLAPGASVSGRCVLPPSERQDQWLVRMSYEPAAAEPAELKPWRQGSTLTLDRWFAAACLPLGPLRISGDLGVAVKGVAEASAPSADAVVVRLAPVSRGCLVGRVVDGQGQPVADALVRLNTYPPPPSQRTGADGRFRFEQLLPDKLEVSANLAGLPTQSQRVEVTAGGQVTVELRLARRYVSGKIEGLPAGWDGMADFGDEVAVATAGRPPALPLYRPPSDRPELMHQGPTQPGLTAFEAAALRLPPEPQPGTYLTTAVPGSRLAELTLLADDPDERFVRVAWWDLGRRTVAADGGPLDLRVPAERAALSVAVSGVTVGQQPEENMVVFTSVESGLPTALLEMARDRTVDWPALPPGDYWLLLACPGQTGLRQRISLRAGEQLKLAMRPATGVAVTGVATGLPEDGSVVLFNDGAYASAEVAEDGAFRLAGVPPGQYQVWFGNSQRYGKREVTVGDKPVDLRLVMAAP